MDPSSRSQLVETLIPIIRKAGKAALKLQHAALPIMTKRDGSPVTAADLASDEILQAGFRASFPTIPVISEENSSAAGSVGLSNDLFLLIDPLDGTKEFINGLDEFTVNVALVEEGRVTAGLIYMPCDERLFFAYGPGLAFEQRAAGSRRNFAYRTVSRQHPIAVVSRSHCDPRTEALLTMLQPCEVRKIGSSLKFALVAAAEADFYLRLGPTMTWDCAAGQAIVEAAGGVVLQADGTPISYLPTPKHKVNGFVAARTTQLAMPLIAALNGLETGTTISDVQQR